MKEGTYFVAVYLDATVWGTKTKSQILSEIKSRSDLKSEEEAKANLANKQRYLRLDIKV